MYRLYIYSTYTILCLPYVNTYIYTVHLFALCKYLRPDSLDDPLIRLGLSQPCIETLQLQCCVFSGYHAMRRTVRSGELVLSDSSDLCNRQIWRLWSVFVDAVSAEAREVPVCYRKFSIPQFISFLIAMPYNRLKMTTQLDGDKTYTQQYSVQGE